ncbi:hypothetical protein HMI01_16200 [Halolactibacillus miurensis]|uniref:Uncharacterized protein n=1 Tax=Halolactibacillus miurensis TaxID=306541 RepID=A0A1I6TER9_9BACI|nr:MULTISPECIES: hypothetical protein [Halolactibacillus]GEM04632.1 hypothetical protein HMI01_16200 [Halolactibacillus miurensis]SFS87645.1 hypothetical protein SAMN05421668_11460 [Halolactibacillus miurensis]
MKKILTTLIISYIIILFDIEINDFDLLIDSIGYGLIAYSLHEYNQTEGTDLRIVFPVLGAILVFVDAFLRYNPTSIVASLSWGAISIIHFLVVLEILKLLHNRAQALQYQDFKDGVDNLKRSYQLIFGVSFGLNMVTLLLPNIVTGIVALIFIVLLIISEIRIIFRINKFRTLEVL